MSLFAFGALALATNVCDLVRFSGRLRLGNDCGLLVGSWGRANFLGRRVLVVLSCFGHDELW